MPENDDLISTGPSQFGRGAFARRAVTRGEVLIRYTGAFLTYKQTSPQTLAVQIGPDLYLGESGGPDDCVNHCCEPNAGLVIRGDPSRPTEMTVDLIALHDLAAGEEIFFDYSTTMDEDDFEFDCGCGANTCRGRIRDFKHLPDELKRAYARQGVVPAYNLRYLK